MMVDRPGHGVRIPDQTSEATLTEVNGKIYMFTRHGGYYVSEDHGATWGSRQNVSGISYTTSCQMNAITYSKKLMERMQFFYQQELMEEKMEKSLLD